MPSTSKQLYRGQVVKVAGPMGWFTVRVSDVNYQAGTFTTSAGHTYRISDVLA